MYRGHTYHIHYTTQKQKQILNYDPHLQSLLDVNMAMNSECGSAVSTLTLTGTVHISDNVSKFHTLTFNGLPVTTK